MLPTLSRGKAGRSGRGVWRNSTCSSASDDLRHLLHRVHRALEAPDVSGHPVGVNRHVHDARVHRDEVVGAERLGDDGRVGAETALHQEMRALAALRLARDAGDDQISGEPNAGAAYGLGGHDDAGKPALHVLHAVAVQAIAFEARRPRIALPPAGERVDVGVAVEHEARPAAGAAQGGDRLEAPGLDLLQIDVVPARAEELLEEQRDRRFFGLEARDADEIAGQLDQTAQNRPVPAPRESGHPSRAVSCIAARIRRR